MERKIKWRRDNIDSDMENEENFPKFHCAITDSPEEYDSGVWEFFRHVIFVESNIGLLMHSDPEWRANYSQILQYVSDVRSSIILTRKPPDSGFLNGLMSDKKEDVDEEDVLLRSKDSIPGLLIRAAAEFEELMALYVRVSRIPRFSSGFSKENFKGLELATEVLFGRSIEISKS